jgi:hypothetical protein
MAKTKKVETESQGLNSEIENSTPTSSETKKTKKTAETAPKKSGVDLPIDITKSQFLDENQRFTKDEFEFINNLVKSKSPAYCLHLGFQNLHHALAILHQNSNVQKLVSVGSASGGDTIERFKLEFSNFSPINTSPFGAIKREFLFSQIPGLDFTLVQLGSNPDTIWKILSELVELTSNGGIILVEADNSLNDVIESFARRSPLVYDLSSNFHGSSKFFVLTVDRKRIQR